MSILSKNLARLFDEEQLTTTKVSQRLTEMGHKISRPGVSSWLPSKNKNKRITAPDHEKLLALAGMFGTSVEQILTNPDCHAGDLMSSVWPDLYFLEKTITMLEKDKTLHYAYKKASFQEKAHIVALLYSLLGETEDINLSGKELLGMMDIKPR